MTKRIPFVSDIKLVYTPTTVRRSDAHITSAAMAAEICRAAFPEGEIALREIFLLLMLDRRCRVIGHNIVSSGGMTKTVVDPRLLFITALAAVSSAIILCHNHPSGSVEPSQEDIQITKRIQDGARVLEIALLDHIILSGEPGSSAYYSFADNGML